MMTYQNIDVKDPAVFARQDGQCFQVEHCLVVVGVGQGSAHLGGQGLTTAALKLGRCVGRAVEEKFQTT